MFIEPDTSIRLIKECQLNKKYEHTFYFNDETEQAEYFKSLECVPLAKQSYQRYAKGVITVQAPMSNVYNVNYMMFKNTSFENKWFYAFVTKVEYVNNVTTRVYYEIDIVQTWFWSCSLHECFVEREHSLTDKIGENLVSEDIYYGPYMYGETNTFKSGTTTMEKMSVVIAYNPGLIDLYEFFVGVDARITILDQGLYSGTYHGIKFAVVETADEGSFGGLNGVFTSTDIFTSGGFICAFMFPSILLPLSNENDPYINVISRGVNAGIIRNTDFDGYTPKNNKLFTHPYTMANLTPGYNEGNDFPFEYFNLTPDSGEAVSNAALFTATANFGLNPGAIAYPLKYLNTDRYLQGNVCIASYPMCTWGSSGLTEWINNYLFKSISSSSIKNSLTKEPGAGDNSQCFNVRDSVGLVKSVFSSGNVHGSGDSDIFSGIEGGKMFTLRVKHITAHYAKIIDDYFSKFGYATMRVKVPNICGRPFWNYVKTKGCCITGPAPSNALDDICSLFNRGITFWNKDAKICDYTNQDNSV